MATRILVVDDVIDIAESLALLFSGMGHVARTAFDGVQALEVAEVFRPQIVLLDLVMPRLDGFHVAAALRSAPQGAPPYLIALTASSGASVNTAVRAAGFDTYLCKPADIMTLISIVTDVSGRLQQQQE